MATSSRQNEMGFTSSKMTNELWTDSCVAHFHLISWFPDFRHYGCKWLWIEKDELFVRKRMYSNQWRNFLKISWCFDWKTGRQWTISVIYRLFAWATTWNMLSGIQRKGAGTGVIKFVQIYVGGYQTDASKSTKIPYLSAVKIPYLSQKIIE